MIPPNNHPYDRGTSSIVTLDDDRLPGDEPRIRIKLTVNPETKKIKQRVTTPEEGASKKITDDDRKALKKANEMLGRFLNPKDDCSIKNQETLILRHFSWLAQADKDHEFEDFDRGYGDPEQRCGSNEDSSANASTNSTLVAKLANVQTTYILSAAAVKRCPAKIYRGPEYVETGSAGFSKPTGPVAANYARYVPLQSAADDDITILPCDSSTETAYYTDVYGAPSFETGYGPASGDLTGTCGDPAVGVFYAYTQDCLDHDICARRLGDQFGDDCGDEFLAAVDDFAFGALNNFPENSPGFCDPTSSSVSRSPGGGSPDSLTPGGRSETLKQI